MKVYPVFVNFFEMSKETVVKCDRERPRFHAFLKVFNIYSNDMSYTQLCQVLLLSSILCSMLSMINSHFVCLRF